MTTSSHLDDHTVITRAERVLSRHAGDETVLLNMADEQYFGLSRVGSSFWVLTEAQAGVTFGAAIQALEQQYDVSAQVLRAELAALIDQLVAGGLVITQVPHAP